MSTILDLETVAIDQAGDLVEPVSAPANYKDPAKIAAYIEDAQLAQIEKAALYPWTARIVALGMDSTGDAKSESVMLCQNETQEAEALHAFWDSIVRDQGRFCDPVIGFASLTFDLPVVLARSLVLGIQHPPMTIDRYRSPHIDLLQKLTWNGVVPARSLKWYAKRFGLPVDDTIDGSDIATLVAVGDWSAVSAHCHSDVRLTKGLARLLGYVKAPTATTPIPEAVF